MKNLILVAICILLTHCTLAIGNIQTGRFTIIDWHPGGEALDLMAELPGKAKLEVGRQTEGVEGVLDSAGNIVTPSLPL